ncbi:DUF2383 domain-containing protein [Orenia marismortui]|uniref:DUF2383 domain-containing protein n=1 Tax=Orenia marismortui TaxID=46469 RepID=UPI0003643AE2|nr:DUF2383 domain-containing protein [Orenia marismortui]
MPEEIINKNRVVSTLNEILKQEHMSIDSYNDFIAKAKNTDTRQLLQNMQQDHKDHASTLTTHIQNLGAAPQEDRGLSGVISNTMMEFGSLLGIETDNNQLLEKLYTKEKNGIKETEKFMNQKLDQRSKKIVTSLLSTRKDHLKKIENNLK